MRDVLRTSLARSLQALPAEDRLAAALPVVCGAALAGHCRVAGVDERGVLRLWVDGSAWLQPLLAMRDVLERDLGRTAGVALRGIHFESADRRRGGAMDE